MPCHKRRRRILRMYGYDEGPAKMESNVDSPSLQFLFWLYGNENNENVCVCVCVRVCEREDE